MQQQRNCWDGCFLCGPLSHASLAVGFSTSRVFLGIIGGEGKAAHLLRVHVSHPVTGGCKYWDLAPPGCGVWTLRRQIVAMRSAGLGPASDCAGESSSNCKRVTRLIVLAIRSRQDRLADWMSIVKMTLICKLCSTKELANQTPWPLVRERTIPTKRPPLVDEI
jgi:hypothetical protein